MCIVYLLFLIVRTYNVRRSSYTVCLVSVFALYSGDCLLACSLSPRTWIHNADANNMGIVAPRWWFWYCCFCWGLPFSVAPAQSRILEKCLTIGETIATSLPGDQQTVEVWPTNTSYNIHGPHRPIGCSTRRVYATVLTVRTAFVSCHHGWLNSIERQVCLGTGDRT